MQQSQYNSPNIALMAMLPAMIDSNQCVKMRICESKICALLIMFLISFNACARNAAADEAKPGLPVARYLLKSTAHTKKQLPTLILAKNAKVKSVSNCDDFVKLIGSWNVQEGVNNMRVASDYQSCVAHAIFAYAKPSRKSAFRNNFSGLIFNKLDLTSFPSSLRNRAEKMKWSISALGMKVSKISETSVLFAPAGWQYRFDLLTKGDFNHDGNEDLLVRFMDQATGGNYYAVEILVLSKTKRKDIWSAQEGVSFLRTMNKTG